MTRIDGIYDERFSGGGFNGCCKALIDLAFEESTVETVSKEYLKTSLQIEAKYSAYICMSADGVQL